MRSNPMIRVLDMNTTDSFYNPNSKILLDQTVINTWLKRTGDTNPIHRDKDYAVRLGFKDIVVPGALIESIFTRMAERCKTHDQMISKVEISHKKVTYINEYLAFNAKIKRDATKGYLIEAEAQNEAGEIVATGNIWVKDI